MKVKIHPTVGTVLVQIDGTTIFNLTGINTQATSNAYAACLVLNPYGGNIGNSCLYDNYVCLDNTGSGPFNTLLGNINITTSVPISNGSSVNFTPLTGSNYSEVNETSGSNTPDGDTSYNFATGSNSDIIDIFNVTTFNPYKTNDALQVYIFSRSTVSSGTRQITPVLYRGGTYYKGNTFNITSTNYQYFIDRSSFLLTDPATSSIWDAALLNSYEYGYDDIGNGILDGTNVYVSQIMIERLGFLNNFLVPNNPIMETG